MGVVNTGADAIDDSDPPSARDAVAWERNQDELRRLNADLEQKAVRLEELNQTLIEREQRLRLALETGRIGLWVWNSTNVANAGDWSDRLKEIFGLPQDAEVTHDVFLKAVHPEDREWVNDSVMRALAGENGGTYQAEYRSVHPTDGSEHWVTARGQAFFDPTGQAVRFIGTVMDITERKRAEQSAARLNDELEVRIAERTADLEVSELLARGQMESLAGTLTALSRESEPEKFLEYVLLALGERFDAHSIGVWEFNPAMERMDMMANCKGKRLHTIPADSLAAAPQVTLSQQTHVIWKEFFRTGAFCVIGEFETNRTRIRKLDGFDEAWHDWTPDAKNEASVVELIERLKAENVAGTLWVPMLTGGAMTGFLSIRLHQHRIPICQEIELTRALAHQAMLAIRLMRLSQASRRAAVVAERNRMARDIHDTLAQGFTGVIMQLEAAKGAAARGELAESSEHIESAQKLARLSLGEARRSVKALRPRSLNGGDLCAALENLLRQMTHGTSLRAEFYVTGDDRTISANWEEGLLRIAQESLTNTLKHAEARSFRATLTFGSGETKLLLRDDGRGFNVQAEHEGFGLIGMKERVDQIGGQFEIRSEAAFGTEILITINHSAPTPQVVEEGI